MERSPIVIESKNPADETEQLSQAVVEAVADAEDVDPIDLTPLYAAIDPDALESLFRPLSGAAGGVGGEVRFSYHGHEVRVTAAGEVSLADCHGR